MKAQIVKIGNSQGIRIPKTLLSQTNLSGEVELEVRKDSIVIKPADSNARELALLSEKALDDWLSPEEDKAWAHLQ